MLSSDYFLDNYGDATQQTLTLLHRLEKGDFLWKRGRLALAWVTMEDAREEAELGIMCESCRKRRNGGETVSQEEVREETEQRRRRPADDLTEKGTGALGGSARVMAAYSLC